ncbi:MAG: tripartite tricarboxylate transporter permease [Clostridiales Family XIII bacterium]|jgi:putative tricarboxylic transport membrane protein|nr:tripartite tricarboxylate transporter permease [Clostridiales Family XIII bacterium]
MDLLTLGFSYVFSDPLTIFLLIGGTLFGIVFGSIPGLTATLGVILLIPFTYGMTPVQGLTLLISVYVGGISGGLIAAILINIPGTPSSIVTTWDGYPMAQNGKPAAALAIGTFCSLLGGLFSAFVLIFIAPPVARVALLFGSWESFALAIMALAVVVSMCSEDILKGLLSVTFGMLLASVGLDRVSGIARLTFDNWQLMAGFSDTALMMGFFAIAEIFSQVRALNGRKEKLEVRKYTFFPPRQEMKDCLTPITLGSLYGTFIGIVPAIGQNVATAIVYNHTKALSKFPEKFGTGYAPGIAASETANNAVNGGALVPLITLGIPGDMVTAALIGGLMIHGLQPGPRLYVDHPEIIGGVMVSYLMANIVMYLLQQGLMRVWVKLLTAKMSYLFPALLLSCVLGVYTINNRMFDVWVMVAGAIVGFVLMKLGLDLVPLILGYILGRLIEKYMRTGLAASHGSFMGILKAPIAVAFLLIAVFLLVAPLIFRLFKQTKAVSDEKDAA